MCRRLLTAIEQVDQTASLYQRYYLNHIIILKIFFDLNHIIARKLILIMIKSRKFALRGSILQSVVFRQLLSSLRVEKLMIPAAGELLETWIDSFSFEPLDESDQEEIRSLSLVAFPRTFLLKKSIPTPPGAHAGNDGVLSFPEIRVVHGVILASCVGRR